MPITAIDNTNSVQYNFSKPVPKKYIDHPAYTEYVYETSATTGKKVGVGIASAFITGLGQCINGEWGKGLAMFAGGLVSGIITTTVSKGLGFCLSMGLSIFSIIDAVKHAKSETVQIVPKDNADTQNPDYDE